MFISVLAVAGPALAAEVSGRVTLDNQPFVGLLKLPDGSEVQITNGEFRIFVPAGEYQVKFETGGRSIPATIQSSTLPVSQDINLVSQR
jgi:hypothetical protein